MSRVYRLQRVQRLPRPLDEVFAFFSSARNLEAITPAHLQFHILTPEPIRMASGTLIDYRLKLSGIPFQWQTRIEAFEPKVRFVDIQLKGPYRRWHHTHEFLAVPDGTLMVDDVEYEMPYGVLGSLVHWMFVRGSLDQIFEFRRQRINELLGLPSAVSSPTK
jgi:ligand-binding SRPBCC domain-containing protein